MFSLSFLPLFSIYSKITEFLHHELFYKQNFLAMSEKLGDLKILIQFMQHAGA